MLLRCLLCSLPIINVISFLYPFVFLQDQTFTNIQRAVDAIAERARELAYDPSYMSPFALHARDNGLAFLGKLKAIL